MAKWVYMFTEGNATMRNLLGGKGANLAEMTSLGLPVPQGFTVTTEACTQYYEDGRKINDEIMDQIMDAIVKLEAVAGKKFGDKENPLLVSVRSGARASIDVYKRQELQGCKGSGRQQKWCICRVFSHSFLQCVAV